MKYPVDDVSNSVPSQGLKWISCFTDGPLTPSAFSLQLFAFWKTGLQDLKFRREGYTLLWEKEKICSGSEFKIPLPPGQSCQQDGTLYVSIQRKGYCPKIMSAVVESSKCGVVSSVWECVLLPCVLPNVQASVYYHVSEMIMKWVKYFFSESHLTLFKCLCH